MMEMPTPCPQCGDTVEFDSMNVCDGCRNLYCKHCLNQSWELCDKCVDDENEIEEEE